MLVIYLILGATMMFQSGMFYSAYRIDKTEGKINYKMLAWSIGLSVFSLYILISMIGKATV